MGENVTLLDGLLISVSSMMIVFIVLYMISIILGLFKTVFYKEGAKSVESKPSLKPEVDDEEERLIVALAASALVGEEKPNSHFCIKKITRVL